LNYQARRSRVAEDAFDLPAVREWDDELAEAGRQAGARIEEGFEQLWAVEPRAHPGARWTDVRPGIADGVTSRALGRRVLQGQLATADPGAAVGERRGECRTDGGEIARHPEAIDSGKQRRAPCRPAGLSP